MKWNNMSPKELVRLIKNEADENSIYNFSIEKVKNIPTEQSPVWAKELIQKVDNITVKLEKIKTRLDILETVVKTVHPNLFS